MFTSRCAGCAETVGDGAECSVCKKLYHFSVTCGGISERRFSRLGSGRATWMCNSCRDASQIGLDVSKEDSQKTSTSTPSKPNFSSGLPLNLGTTSSSSASTPKQPMIMKDD